MADYDHSAGLQFTPGLDHARASMNSDDNNMYAEESQEVYVSKGQTYLQDVEADNGDLPVAVSTNDRDRRSKYSFLPVWLRDSPTCVKVTTAAATLLVVIFVAIMVSGIAQLPNDDTSKFNSSANTGTGTDGGSTDGGTNIGSGNPDVVDVVPTPGPVSDVITSSPVADSQVPVTPSPSIISEGVVPITTPSPTPEPTLPPLATFKPTEQPTFPALDCPNNLEETVTIDPVTVFSYAFVLTESGDNGIMCGRLQVQNHKGWVGFAVSPNGSMVGSDAIIGEPSTKSVLKYDLNGKGANLVNIVETAKQTLEDASIAEDKGSTIMTFTKRLVEEGENAITATGRNVFLHARGDDTTIGYHSTRGVFVLDFTKTDSPTLQPTEKVTTPQPTTEPELADSALQCTAYSPCTSCLGSCESNFDCAGELQCFMRRNGEPIPGCLGQGKFGQNYCYNPFAGLDDTAILLTTSEEECDKKATCSKCFGGCRADEQCDKDLFCYRRFDNPFRPVPGCAGQGESGMHYCFDPDDIPRGS
mmetsp:Transcript_11367/g.16304  ORF Transcript_11367/g.16304 Transcript_11367/m.16304 type:complete len:530 (+) Transcript_11367:236-1825(+)